VDLADPDHEQQVDAVAGILADLELAEKPRLLAGNKSDRLSPAEAERRAASLGAVPISALDRSSLAPLLAAIERVLWKEGRESNDEREARAAVSA
jgi:GTP-binding protein HflX